MTDRPHPPEKLRAVALLAAAIAFLVYANNLGNEFAMDDHYNVVTNPDVQSLKQIPQLFTQAWGSNADDYSQDINRSYWRPMVATSYALDHAIWGMNPFGFHLSNNLFHALVTALVTLLIGGLLGSTRAAFAGGIVFALHPIHTEAVNLISYRTELLAAGFAVSAMLLLPHERRPGLRRLLLIPLLYAGGLASKETAVTLPGWLALIDLARLQVTKDPSRFRQLRDLLPGYLCLALVLIGYLALRHVLLDAGTIHFFAEMDTPLLILSVAKIYLLDLGLLLVPWPLTPFYDWTIVPPAFSLYDAEGLAGLLAFSLTLLIGGLLWRRRPMASVGLGFWLLGLLPFLHLVPLPVGAAERFLYFPSIGICLVVGVIAQQTLQWSVPTQKVLTGACLLLVISMASATLTRNQAWRSNEDLLEQAVADFPASFNARMGLGQLYFREARYAEAVDSFSAADAILPDFPPNVVWLARALLASQRESEALSVLNQALAKRGPEPALMALRTEVLQVLQERPAPHR